MKKKWRSLLFFIISTLWIGCDLHIDKEIETRKKVKADKKQEPPVINIINKMEQDPTNKKSSDNTAKKKAEDAAFDFLYKKMNHLKIFKTICLMSSINSPNGQCKNNLKNCLDTVNKNSQYSIKLTIKDDKKNIKKLMKMSEASEEEYLATFNLINKILPSLSGLTCDSSKTKIKIATESFSKIASDVFHGQNEKIDKMKLIAEILIERAFDLGFFGRDETKIRNSLLH